MRRAGLLGRRAAGCSTAPVGSSVVARTDDAPRVEEHAYEEALGRVTRQTSLYDGLDQRVFAAVSWQTWAFRQARVDAEARFMSLSRAEREARLAIEREEAARYTDFFLGFYTAQPSWNDLSAHDSIWRVELQPEGGPAIQPIEIRRIERPDANLVALYPYLTSFWVGYRIRFPAEDERGRSLFPVGSPRMTLRFASAVGKVEVTYSTVGYERPAPPPPLP